MPDELWMEVCDIVQKTGIKTIPKKKNCKKAKLQSEDAGVQPRWIQGIRRVDGVGVERLVYLLI